MKFDINRLSILAGIGNSSTSQTGSSNKQALNEAQNRSYHEDPGFSEDSCLHMMLSCPSLQTIREDFLCQMVSICPQIINYLEFSKTLLIAIVDLSSTKLPTEIREGWSDLSEAYRIGRNFTYAMYRKRKLLLEALAKKRAVQSNNQ